MTPVSERASAIEPVDDALSVATMGSDVDVLVVRALIAVAFGSNEYFPELASMYSVPYVPTSCRVYVTDG